MKKVYMQSEIKVVVLAVEDVATASIQNGGSYYENELPGVPFGNSIFGETF